MAFKASTISAEMAFTSIRKQAVATKIYLTQQRGLMVGLVVNSSVPLAVIQHLATVIPALIAQAATPGLLAYAQDQLNDPAYDVVGEFTTMRNRMVAVRDALTAAFPKDGSNFLLYQTFTAEGNIVPSRTFTAAQMAPAVALIDSVIATIE